MRTEHVDQVLNKAAQRLSSLLLAHMETLDLSPARIQRLRDVAKNAYFPSNWPWLLKELRDAIYDTAFSRYLTWRNQPQKDVETAKRKNDGELTEAVPQNKRPAPSNSSSGKNPSSNSGPSTKHTIPVVSEGGQTHSTPPSQANTRKAKGKRRNAKKVRTAS
jgi:hypothetical protein